MQKTAKFQKPHKEAKQQTGDRKKQEEHVLLPGEQDLQHHFCLWPHHEPPQLSTCCSPELP